MLSPSIYCFAREPGRLYDVCFADENLAEGWFHMMRIIKAVGGQIIEFLHQIEEFQKMLWEKRKFITETQYCVTVGNIAEDFYPEIAANEKQWEEWKALGMAPGTASGTADVSSARSTPGTTSGTADVSSASSTPSTTEYKGWHTRGYLPHCDAEALIQSVTFRLHDSVPAKLIQQRKQELHWQEGLSTDSQQAEEPRKRIENYQHTGAEDCYLRDERIARLVLGAE